MRPLVAAAALATLAVLHGGALAAGPQMPFEPLSATSAAEVTAASAPGLQGIRTGRWPAALVDGRWLRPGEAVAGHRLVEVHGDGVVWLAADGRRHRATWPATLPDEPTRKDDKP
ncbi:MAG: hypothetical protein KDF63_09735 [Rhodoferax sp.]|jgi:hypothetical protein|nr:hypothetical protein [Rhodoferax sp.]